MSRTLTIATRESPLALWQAEFVRDALTRAHPGLEVNLLGMTSRGDQLLDVPLAKVGGKGLFVNSLPQMEEAFGQFAICGPYSDDFKSLMKNHPQVASHAIEKFLGSSG